MEYEQRDKNAFEHRVPDPFQVKERQSFTSAVLATALFRCWHIILFFTLWAMAISLIIRYVHNISFQSTLLGP
jgi:ion channel-forming bestrophin family protein